MAPRRRYSALIRYPRLSTPFAIRLSRRSLVGVLLTYVALVTVWVGIVSVAVYHLGNRGVDASEALRQALWGMWGPDNLLGVRGESTGFYIVAAANALVSVLLPVFVLGAFVFKLFRHDPLKWRKGLTIEAHPAGHFVLAARFYNRFTVPVADVCVRAWLRWTSAENPTVLRNKRLQLLVRGMHDDAPVWPLAIPAEPTTVRVVVASTGTDDMPFGDETFTIQGETVTRDDASIVLIAEGMATGINEQFRSMTTYSLRGDIEAELFQDITPNVRDQVEWRNFDGTQLTYVFVYGSLMREDDLRMAGLGDGERIRVSLRDWRRRWNVASDPAKKNRVYRKSDGNVFDGWVASLGIEAAIDEQVTGVVVEVGYETLAEFDKREQEYLRTDVTRLIVWRALRPSRPFRVFTYVPKPEAVQEFERRREDQTLAVVQSYYSSVAMAAEAINDDDRDFDQATSLDGIPILALTREDH